MVPCVSMFAGGITPSPSASEKSMGKIGRVSVLHGTVHLKDGIPQASIELQCTLAVSEQDLAQAEARILMLPDDDAGQRDQPQENSVRARASAPSDRATPSSKGDKNVPGGAIPARLLACSDDSQWIAMQSLSGSVTILLHDRDRSVLRIFCHFPLHDLSSSLQVPESTCDSIEMAWLGQRLVLLAPAGTG